MDAGMSPDVPCGKTCVWGVWWGEVSLLDVLVLLCVCVWIFCCWHGCVSVVWCVSVLLYVFCFVVGPWWVVGVRVCGHIVVSWCFWLCICACGLCWTCHVVDCWCFAIRIVVDVGVVRGCILLEGWGLRCHWCVVWGWWGFVSRCWMCCDMVCSLGYFVGSDLLCLSHCVLCWWLCSWLLVCWTFGAWQLDASGILSVWGIGSICAVWIFAVPGYVFCCGFVLLDGVWCTMLLFAGVYGSFVAVQMVRFSERVGWMFWWYVRQSSC